MLLEVVAEDRGGLGGELEDEVELVEWIVGGQVAVPAVRDAVVAGVAFRAFAGDGVSAPKVRVGPDQGVAGDDGLEGSVGGRSDQGQPLASRISWWGLGPGRHRAFSGIRRKAFEM